ncbi:MAG: hypothetical protein ABR540_15800 [Acidimicrobiales bacterium]|nr:hypothetical protein [Actinomycetota bacterium]
MLVAILLAGGVMAGAMSTASAAPARQSGTWVGVVEQHGNHFDYVGRPCPVEVEVCAAFVARYRIVPVSRAARQALPEVSGGTARLEGVLVTRGDRVHHGILFVAHVAPAG